MNEELRKLLDQFNNAQAEIRNALQKQREEIQAHGEGREETGRRVDEIGNRLEQISNDIREVQTRVQNAETEIARNGVRGGGDGDADKTPGQRFVESEQYQDAVRNHREKSDIVEIGSFHPRNTLITSAPDSGGGLVVPHRMPGIIAAPDRGLRIRDLIDVQPTQSNSIEYVEETGFTNNAAPTAEGGQKPESALAFEVKSASVQTIPHWVPATRQIISDAGQLRSYIDGRLTYGIKIVEESQILYGDGNSPNLGGIATNASVQTYAWSSGKLGDTKVDAIRRAITLARVAEYPVTGVVLHPTDWEDIELLKGTDKHYIWVVVSVGGVMQVWKVPVVETTAVSAGESVLGAWSLGATLWDREQTTIRISDSHSDYFIKNKVAILAEERVALTVHRPEAFVVVDFDTAPVESSS